jgi:WD40 repeat protein
VLSLTFLGDNRTLVSGSWYPDYTMKMWDADLGVLKQDVTSHNAPVSDVLFAPGNHHAVSAAGSAKVWNVLNGSPIRTNSGSATNIACSSDGRLLAVPGFNKDLLVYRLSDGALLKTLGGFPEQVTGAAFSNDGTLLAAGAFFNGTDDKVRLFRTSDWVQVGQLSGTFLFGPFTSMNFSANGQYLAAVCEGAPAVWRLSDGAVVFQPNEGASQIRFSADGQLVAITGNTTKIFRVADWSLQRSLPTSMAQALDFSPDGKVLATTEYGSIKIWRVSDGSLLANYTEGVGYGGFAATSIRFSPNGRMFGYGLYDGTFVAAHNPFFLTNSPPGIGK